LRRGPAGDAATAGRSAQTHLAAFGGPAPLPRGIDQSLFGAAAKPAASGGGIAVDHHPPGPTQPGGCFVLSLGPNRTLFSPAEISIGAARQRSHGHAISLPGRKTLVA